MCKEGGGVFSGAYSTHNELYMFEFAAGCISLEHPLNGKVELFNTTVGSTASYTCNRGYSLSNGNNTLTCQANGQWSGCPPSCDCESIPTVCNIKVIKCLVSQTFGFSTRWEEGSLISGSSLINGGSYLWVHAI